MFSIRSQLPISASVSIPAEQSQSISTIPGGRKIETVPEKEGLLVFLGTKSVGEYALNILGQNVSRVTTGKKPYDILFLHEATKQDFDKKKTEFTFPGANRSYLQSSNTDVAAAAAISIAATEMKTILPKDLTPEKLNRPGFPGECFICELRLPDHRFRWKHNKLFLLLPEEYGPAFPAIVDCYTSPPT
ncbi:T3SS effector OspB [Escherichia coli]|nr:T3SS effector OspB [Escherichia coli]